MTKHFRTHDIAALMYGGGIAGTLSQRSAELLNGLQGNLSEFANALNGLNAGSTSFVSEAESIANQAIVQIAAASTQGAQEISAGFDESENAKRYFHAFVLSHGITRKPKQPDALFSAVVFAALSIIEGMLTALFFLGGGFVAGFGEALGLGLSISGINVVVAGLIGGFVFGRFWNCGVHAPEPDPVITRKRLAGRVGSVLTACVLLVLLLASGILRAGGEPEHLGFTFENIGLAATNFHSLLLWALGLSFAILAWRKGLSAFSDPYPGFSEASESITNAEDGIRDAYHDTGREIEDISEEALDELDELSEYARDASEERDDALKAIRSQKEELLSAIASAPPQFAAFCEAQSSVQRMLNRKGEDPNLSRIKKAFSDEIAALQAQVPEVPDSSRLDPENIEKAVEAAKAKVAQARIRAGETVNEAYSKALSHNS